MRYFGWIFIFFITLYIIPLGSRPMLSPVEFDFAETAREMLETGHGVTPPEVPGGTSACAMAPNRFPMAYWLTVACFKLFGINNFSARLPAALAAGLAAVLISVLIRQSLRDEKLASLVSMIYMSFLMVYLTGNLALAEGIFAAFNTGCVGTLFLALQEQSFNRRKFLLLAIAGGFTALAFLSGGIEAVIYPAVTLIAYLLICGRLRELPVIALPSLFFAALPLIPWALCLREKMPNYWQELLRLHHFTAGFGSFPWYVYPAAAVIGLIPVIILLPAALMTGRESWKRLFRQPLCRYATCALAMPLVVMMICRNVSPATVLICFPALAVLITLGIQAYFNNGGHHRAYDWMMNLWALLLIATGILEAAGWFFRDRVEAYLEALPVTPMALIILGVTSIIGGGVILYSRRGNWRSRLYLFFFSLAILPLGVSWCITGGRRLPEHALRSFIDGNHIRHEPGSVILTGRRLGSAVSWCAAGCDVRILDGTAAAKGSGIRYVILECDDPAWKDLPKPDRLSCNGPFTCAVFAGGDNR